MRALPAPRCWRLWTHMLNINSFFIPLMFIYWLTVLRQNNKWSLLCENEANQEKLPRNNLCIFYTYHIVAILYNKYTCRAFLWFRLKKEKKIHFVLVVRKRKHVSHIISIAMAIIFQLQPYGDVNFNKWKRTLLVSTKTSLISRSSRSKGGKVQED